MGDWDVTKHPLTDLGITDDVLLDWLRNSLAGPDSAGVAEAINKAINTQIATHGLNDDGSWAGDWDAASVVEAALYAREIVVAANAIADDPSTQEAMGRGAESLIFGIGGLSVRFIGWDEDEDAEYDLGIGHLDPPGQDAIRRILSTARIDDVNALDPRLLVVGGWACGGRYYHIIRLGLRNQ